MAKKAAAEGQSQDREIQVGDNVWINKEGHPLHGLNAEVKVIGEKSVTVRRDDLDHHVEPGILSLANPPEAVSQPEAKE